MAAPSSNMPDKASSESVTALERGFAVLRCLGPATPALTHQEIARITGIAKPTVTRITQTLVRMGYLEANHTDGRFRLAPGVLELSYTYLNNLDVRAAALPFMTELSHQTKATVNMAVRQGDTMVVIETVKAPDAIFAMNIRVGFGFPLLETAIGWSYLSTLSPDERLALLQEPAFQGIEGAREKIEHAEGAIRDCQTRGYCEIKGEWRTGIVGVAAAFVCRHEHRTYAFNCAGPELNTPDLMSLEAAGAKLVDMIRKLESRVQPGA